MSSSPDLDPADFGDPTALDLGTYRGGGSVDMAAVRVADIAEQLRRCFGVEKVQFFFNGTPAVLRASDNVTTVVADWSARRAEFRRAQTA